MQNPFVYGEVVPASAFVDREVELERLTGDLLAGQKVFLISPRRYGKSSLVQQALARRGEAGRDDGQRHGQQLQLVRRLSRGLRPGAPHRGGQAGPRAGLADADLLGSLRPELRLEPGSRLSLVVSRRADRRATSPAWPKRSSRCRRSSRHCASAALAIALDEFQAINAFDEGSHESSTRCAPPFSTSADVGYVFSGSEPTLMERMLSRSRPFYKAGPVHAPRADSGRPVCRFLETRFQKTGFRPEPGLGAAIVELAGNLPYDVQRLAHETWDDVRADGVEAGRARPAARDAASPAQRARRAFRNHVAAAHRTAARGAARRRPGGRSGAAERRRARASSPDRPVERPGVARRARA